jgi:hypothetical protein
VYLAREALAHAGAGRSDQAVTVGTAALSVAIETGRIVNELARLDNAIAQWDSISEMAEFRDYLTSALPHEKDRTPTT